MAIGANEKKDIESSPDGKDVKFDNEKDLEGGARRGSVNPGGRRLSRMDRTVDDADVDSDIGIGAQIEMEKDNAIKYRTCSWQKVWLHLSPPLCKLIQLNRVYHEREPHFLTISCVSDSVRIVKVG